MFQFIESICCVNNSLRNLEFHQARLNRTHRHFFPEAQPLSLAKDIEIPSHLTNDKYKLRVLYAETIQEISFQPYQPHPLQSISFAPIDSSFDYSHKSTDRSYLSTLVNNYQTDDLILIKNGYITDTTLANLVFFDGYQWVTPTTYLLKGCMRSWLLSTGQIIEKEIRPEDLIHYQSFKRINAMMSLEESPSLPISLII